MSDASYSLPRLRSMRPEQFARPDAALAGAATENLKALFDSLQALGAGVGRPVTLRELYVDGFDSEQLWSMVQLDHDALLEHLDEKIEALAALPAESVDALLLAPEVSDDDDEEDDSSNPSDSGPEQDAEEGEEEDDDEDEDEEEDEDEDEVEEYDEEEEDDEDEEEDEDEDEEEEENEENEEE